MLNTWVDLVWSTCLKISSPKPGPNSIPSLCCSTPIWWRSSKCSQWCHLWCSWWRREFCVILGHSAHPPVRSQARIGGSLTMRLPIRTMCHLFNTIPSNWAQHFFPQYFPISFTTSWKLRIRRPCKWTLFAGRNLVRSADALPGPGGNENIFLMESQELTTKNKISGELARSDLDAMEKDARHAMFSHNHLFKIAVREFWRQARDAVHQALKESSERRSDDARNSGCPESRWGTNGRK